MNDFTGDNHQAAWIRAPEVVAQEQHILTMAEALLAWMQHVPWTPEAAASIDAYFQSHTMRNPASEPLASGDEYTGVRESWLLEKMDREANRFLGELLRATWCRRRWQEHYGERPRGGL